MFNERKFLKEATYCDAILHCFSYFCPHLGRASQQYERVNHKLRIHEHITEQDGRRWEDPPVQTNHEHAWDVQTVKKKVSNKSLESLLACP